MHSTHGQRQNYDQRKGERGGVDREWKNKKLKTNKTISNLISENS